MHNLKYSKKCYLFAKNKSASQGKYNFKGYTLN